MWAWTFAGVEWKAAKSETSKVRKLSATQAFVDHRLSSNYSGKFRIVEFLVSAVFRSISNFGCRWCGESFQSSIYWASSSKKSQIKPKSIYNIFRRKNLSCWHNCKHMYIGSTNSIIRPKTSSTFLWKQLKDFFRNSFFLAGILRIWSKLSSTNAQFFSNHFSKQLSVPKTDNVTLKHFLKRVKKQS